MLLCKEKWELADDSVRGRSKKCWAPKEQQRKEYQVIPALKAPTRNFTVNVSASVPTLSFAHQLALPQRGVFFFDTYGKLHFFFAS